MINKLTSVLLIITWVLCGFIGLAFIGYVMWILFGINFFLGFSGPIFFVEIYWRDFYWLVLLILIIAYPISKAIDNKIFFKFTLITITVSLGMWLIIPYMKDYSYELPSSENKITFLTKNFKKSNNPAFRLQQSARYLFDSGCNYWLEQWSSDGKYIKISERPYGIKNCLKSNEAVINIESAGLTSNFESLEFLERPWPERKPESVSDYVLEDESFKVIDALLSPGDDLYAIVVGKSSLMGPSDIILINKE